MNIKSITKKAKQLKNELGGRIFAFPIEENNPFSKYAITYLTHNQYITYPEALSINEVASAIQYTIEGLNENGANVEYEADVRFLSYEAQVNAPDVTMRKLKKKGYFEQTNEPFLKEGKDVMRKPNTTEEEYYFSGLGAIKMTYLTAIEDNNPKAFGFMDEFYKILAMNRYGKTAAAIKQEVRRMNKSQGIHWIEKTYKRYIKDDSVIHQLFIV